MLTPPLPESPLFPLRPRRLRALRLLAAIVALSGSARAACPATPEQIERSARAAAAAFAAMDPQGFQDAHASLREETGCLSAAPTPTQGALVHQAEALAAFQVKDVPGTLGSLLAMHESDPGWALSTDLAPPGAPLDLRDVEARGLPPSPRVAPALAPGLSLVVDGRVSTDLPATRPSLVLVLGLSGEVAWSGLVPAGGALPPIADPKPAPPELALAAAGSQALDPTLPPPARTRRKPAGPLVLSAGGTALVAGGLWAAYAFDSQRVETIAGLIASGATGDEWRAAGLEPMTADEIASLHDRARGLEVGAQVATGLSLGLGAVGLVFVW